MTSENIDEHYYHDICQFSGGGGGGGGGVGREASHPAPPHHSNQITGYNINYVKQVCLMSQS